MTERKVRTFRVAEIFGPTIQGEGRNVGMPCHFVRFGGCDFRCEWCDTPHAVLPEQVNELPRMDPFQIFHAVNNLGEPNDFVRWVVLTGGNPGLLNLDLLCDLFHNASFKVMVETQGTTYREWYTEVDDLCFSPKPPSSKMDWDFDLFDRILNRLVEDAVKVAKSGDRWTFPMPYLKVPVFTEEDLDFAEKVHARWNDLEMFLSIGNADPSLPTVGNPNPDVPPRTDLTRDYVLDKFKSVTEDVLASRPSLQDCRIFPQQHTLLWGNKRGH